MQVCQAASKLAKEEVAAEVTMITTGAAVSEEVAVVPGCTAEVGDPDRSLGDLKACSFHHPAVSFRYDNHKKIQSTSGIGKYILSK